ncbi:MAG: hypothetical protein B6240_11695 [Desulfobacteraceae bacterium 4572_87]|nr:MAG: hypothetical protein B6240_11695 [Desulfobacteraceae bacterium 4572_87]
MIANLFDESLELAGSRSIARTEIPLGVGGYVSELKMPEIAHQMNRFQETMVSPGCHSRFCAIDTECADYCCHPFYSDDPKRALSLQGKRLCGDYTLKGTKKLLLYGDHFSFL